MTFFRIGFCGVDESVDDLEKLADLSRLYPYVEWGILFRTEKQGLPRFPNEEWVHRLSDTKQNCSEMKLAAHLCSSRCEEVLYGDCTFLFKLLSLGFGRVQINATQANGVNIAALPDPAISLLSCINAVPQLEFIIQKNKETEPLWMPILQLNQRPPNVSFLFDESLGTGVLAKTYPSPEIVQYMPCGYAGGIGPSNIVSVLTAIDDQFPKQTVNVEIRDPWIDMESSLRSASSSGTDIFDLAKVIECIEQTKSFDFK